MLAMAAPFLAIVVILMHHKLRPHGSARHTRAAELLDSAPRPEALTRSIIAEHHLPTTLL
jgi:hypothetical protein